MSPAQTEKVNYWLPIIAGALGLALSTGVAWGMIGGDVRQNARDIKAIKSREISLSDTITDIRVAHGSISAQIIALTARVDTTVRILEKQYGPLPPRGS